MSIFFKVNKLPIYIERVDHFEEIQNRKALMNQDDDIVLDIVSNDYRVITNYEVYTNITKALDYNNIKWKLGRNESVRNGINNLIEIELPEYMIRTKYANASLRLYILNDFVRGSKPIIKSGFVTNFNGTMILNSTMLTELFNEEDLNINMVKYINEIYKNLNYYISSLANNSFNDVRSVLDFVEANNNESNTFKKEFIEIWDNVYEGTLNSWVIMNIYLDVISRKSNARLINKMRYYSNLYRRFNYFIEVL